MNISYSGIVLTDDSQQNLVASLIDMIPPDWEIVAHHMTICLGPLVHPTKASHNYSDFGVPGTPYDLRVTAIGASEKAMAVMVDSPFPTQNEQKGGFAHITIAVNRAAGGKPFDSNKIALANFEDISNRNLIVKGHVEEVPQ
jgi:hypothetical protein